MKILHTMIRVGDLVRSIEFYTGALGMKLRRQKEYSAGRFTLAFLGYGDEGGHEIELTHNWDTPAYEKGNGFGHIALKTDDIYRTTSKIREKGWNITREPGPMKHGTTIIAFVEDPDGYLIELIQE